jgi:hypothetical protein
VTKKVIVYINEFMAPPEMHMFTYYQPFGKTIEMYKTSSVRHAYYSRKPSVTNVAVNRASKAMS